MQFTGKGRDAETGLDYFGARYFASVQGRMSSPDAPFADQHPDDPQSWNSYSYVRNNPLAFVDPAGRACTILASRGTFCQRAPVYAEMDRKLSSQTRFFGAAAAVNEAMVSMEVPGFSIFMASGATRGFIVDVGKKLEGFNQGIAAEISSGSFQGEGIDAKIVQREQKFVQEQLDALKKSDPAAYSKVISDSNAGLNPTGFFREAGKRNSTDGAYLKVLDRVRKSLRRNIDFAKQSDREAVGNAIINHIRATGGCDLVQTQIAGCPQN